MNPLVSVCTTSFEHFQFLDEYFQSLVDQTYRPLEVVFGDDCSPDETHAKVLEWQPKLETAGVLTEFFRNSTNRGCHRTCAEVADRASGRFLCWLESDDLFKPTKVEESVRFLQRTGYPLMHSDHDRITPDGLIPNFWKHQNRQILNPTPWHQILGLANTVMTCTLVVDRVIWLDHPGPTEWEHRGYAMGDFPSALWLSRRYPMGYLDQSLSIYRMHGGGAMSSKADQIYHSGIKIMEDCRNGLL